MSNWENRPLRWSQIHYAALDAYVLIKLMDALMLEAINKKIDVSKFMLKNSSKKVDKKQMDEGKKK